MLLCKVRASVVIFDCISSAKTAMCVSSATLLLAQAARVVGRRPAQPWELGTCPATVPYNLCGGL
eukprot:5701883-Amphidinium_carterae.1